MNIKTGANYKLELRKITQNYIKQLHEMKNELEKIIKEIPEEIKKDKTKYSFFYEITLNEINEIFGLFELGARKRKFLEVINTRFNFTDKEKEILISIYDGLSINDLKKKYINSKKTIHTHLQNILIKIENDIILNNMLKEADAEIKDYYKNCGGDNEKYKLTKPYETIKRFVNIHF